MGLAERHHHIADGRLECAGRRRQTVGPDQGGGGPPLRFVEAGEEGLAVDQIDPDDQVPALLLIPDGASSRRPARIETCSP